MKKPTLVKQGQALEGDLARILAASPFLDVRTERARVRPGQLVDAWFTDGDTTRPVVIEFKAQVGPEAARQLRHYADALPPGAILLVVSRHISRNAQEILRETRGSINYIDEDGSIHLTAPNSFVHVEAPPEATEDARKSPIRLRGKAGLIGQLILLHADRAWRIDEASREAGVSLGLAHRVFSELEVAGIVESTGSGPRRRRRLRDKATLLDKLAQDDARAFEAPAVGAFRRARSGHEAAEKISDRLAAEGVEHAVSGFVAANLVAPVLTAVPAAEVRVTASVPISSIIDSAGCHRTNDGATVKFIQERDDVGLAFRRRERGLWVANPVRVYLDVLRDPRRGEEQAEMLRHWMLGE